MNIQLSQTLLSQIQLAIKNSKPPTHYWDSNDELSVEEVNQLLVLPDGKETVEYNRNLECWDSFHETERDHILDILKKFRPQIEAEGGEYGNVSDKDLQELIEKYDLLSFSPGVDANLSQLIRNSRSTLRIVIQFNLQQHHEGWRWKRDVSYDEVKDILRLFNINPRHIHKSFPYHARRKGKPVIKPEDLIDLWDNASYGGQYTMPITLDLADFLKNREHYHTGITLHKGSRLWIHEYGNGSGSSGGHLQKKLVIKKANIDYHFGDDRDTSGYGMDETYGLYYTAWHNHITPLKTGSPTPYTLKPVEEVIRYCYYRHFDSVQEKIEKQFPTVAKTYFNKNSKAHYRACQVSENRGQVHLIHALLIAEEATGEIVWCNINSSTRSHEIFTLFKAKIERLYQKKQAA